MGIRPRLRIVTGKGGVGKTLVATALARAEALAGRRALLAEVQGQGKVASLLGCEPLGDRMGEVLDRLWIVDLNPRAAMREYALLTFRFEAVYNAVFENRVVRRFLRLIPSLGELVMLGKIQYHEQEKVGDQSRFDVIVVDAPSTGHALAMLRAPGIVERTVPPGPLRDITRDLRQLLTCHRRTVLHVVTTPEEMPVNEAIELERQAASLLGIALGTTIINQRLEALPSEALSRIEPLAARDDFGYFCDAVRLRAARRRAGDELLRRLPAYMLDRSIDLPRLAASEIGPAELDLFAERLRSILDPSVGGAR